MARPFLLIEDSHTEVQAFTRLVTRIGLVNPVSVQATVASAQASLGAAQAPHLLPVLIFAGTEMRGGHSLDLIEWLAAQRPELAVIPVVALLDGADEEGWRRAAEAGVAAVPRPLDMHRLIGAMKTLGLAEKVKIDRTTLMVQVELCPRGSG